MGVTNLVVKKLLGNGQIAAESFWDSDMSQPAFRSGGKLARLVSSSPGSNDGFRVDRYVAEGCRLILFEEGTGAAHTILAATYSSLRGPLTVDGVDPRSLGLGQTWQNMTASRVKGTTYTNTSGRPIMVIVKGGQGGDSGGDLYINGVLVAGSYASATNHVWTVSGIIPPGDTYRVDGAYATITVWHELRA